MTGGDEAAARAVVLTVAADGSVSVLVDGEPVSGGDGSWVRDSFAVILDEVTGHRGVDALVEVRECDGSVFTDRVAAAPARSQGLDKAAATIPCDGFVPGEQVAVAAVTGYRRADPAGRVLARLPDSGAGLLLVGRVSGTVHVLGG